MPIRKDLCLGLKAYKPPSADVYLACGCLKDEEVLELWLVGRGIWDHYAPSKRCVDRCI